MPFPQILQADGLRRLLRATLLGVCLLWVGTIAYAQRDSADAALKAVVVDAVLDSSDANKWVVFPKDADSSAHYKGVRVSFLGFILNKNKVKPYYGLELTPIPYMNYAPETSLGFGFLGVLILPRSAAKAHWRRSIMEVAVAYTLRNQSEFKIRPDFWLADNRLHLNGFFRIRSFPFFFYGLGNRTLAEDREAYRGVGLKARGVAEWAPIKHIYLGLGLEFDMETMRERQEGGMLAADSITGSSSYRIFGPTLGIIYDNRDNIFFARKGGYYGLNSAFYPKALGSTTPYWQVELDIRKFITLAPKHTLAMQFQAAYVSDGAPFQLLPTFGGSNMMRGQFSGRFRDQVMMAVQLEHRWNFWKKYGVTVFGGVGDVLPGFKSWDKWATKYSVGFGFRMRVSDDGINVRADFGFGTAFSQYLDFGEAF